MHAAEDIGGSGQATIASMLGAQAAALQPTLACSRCTPFIDTYVVTCECERLCSCTVGLFEQTEAGLPGATIPPCVSWHTLQHQRHGARYTLYRYTTVRMLRARLAMLQFPLSLIPFLCDACHMRPVHRSYFETHCTSLPPFHNLRASADVSQSGFAQSLFLYGRCASSGGVCTGHLGTFAS